METVEKKEYRLENLSCANCAMKFEKNIKALPEVEDALVNFGASKVSIVGNATVEEIEEAGAFDGIKVIPLNQRKSERIPFFQQKHNVLTTISFLFLVVGTITSFIYAEDHPAAIALFVLSIIVGGAELFKVGFSNLIRFEFDMKNTYDHRYYRSCDNRGMA